MLFATARLTCLPLTIRAIDGDTIHICGEGVSRAAIAAPELSSGGGGQ